MTENNVSGVSALADVQQVAELLQVSPRSVYRLADAGKLPAPVRLGSCVRWSRAELADWLSQGCPNCRQVRGGGQR